MTGCQHPQVGGQRIAAWGIGLVLSLIMTASGTALGIAHATRTLGLEPGGDILDVLQDMEPRLLALAHS